MTPEPDVAPADGTTGVVGPAGRFHPAGRVGARAGT